MKYLVNLFNWRDAYNYTRARVIRDQFIKDQIISKEDQIDLIGELRRGGQKPGLQQGPININPFVVF